MYMYLQAKETVSKFQLLFLVIMHTQEILGKQENSFSLFLSGTCEISFVQNMSSSCFVKSQDSFLFDFLFFSTSI